MVTSSFFTHARKMFIAWAFFLAVYVVGYAMLRWNDVLVRKQLLNYRNFTSLVTVVHSNFDRRNTAVASFKNRAASFAAFAYTPLRQMEEAFWNSSSD